MFIYCGAKQYDNSKNKWRVWYLLDLSVVRTLESFKYFKQMTVSVTEVLWHPICSEPESFYNNKPLHESDFSDTLRFPCFGAWRLVPHSLAT